LKKYLIIDTETGGLNPQINPLLEISMVVVDEQNTERDRFYAKLPPIGLKSAKAMVVNSYYFHPKDDSLREESHIVEDLMRWSTVVYQQYNPILVGHNLRFDLEFIDALCRRNELEAWSQIWSIHHLDTMNLAFLAKECGLLQTERLTLKGVAKALGIEAANAHSAEGDTKITSEVLMSLLALFRK